MYFLKYGCICILVISEVVENSEAFVSKLSRGKNTPSDFVIKNSQAHEFCTNKKIRHFIQYYHNVLTYILVSNVDLFQF